MVTWEPWVFFFSFVHGVLPFVQQGLGDSDSCWGHSWDQSPSGTLFKVPSPATQCVIVPSVEW